MKSHRRKFRRIRRALVLGLGVMSLAAPSAMAVQGEKFIGPGPSNSQSLSPQVGSPDSQDARDHRGVYADSTKQHSVVSPDAGDARARTGVYAQSNPQVGSPDARDARAHVGVYDGNASAQVGSPDARDARARVGVYDGSPSTEPVRPSITNVIDDGFDWGSAGIGSAITIALMLLTLVALRGTSRLRTSH